LWVIIEKKVEAYEEKIEELKHKLAMKSSEIGIKERSKDKVIAQLADWEDKISKLNKRLKNTKSKEEAEEMLNRISL